MAAVYHLAMAPSDEFAGDESPDTAELVMAASSGDSAAFNALVDRFERLVWWVIRQSGLDDATAADVSQTTWMRFVENIDRLSNPAAAGAWLATTARRESYAASRRAGRESPLMHDIDTATTDELDEALLASEEHVAVRRAFLDLDERCQQMLRLVTDDPPMPYADVGEVMDLAVGSIGPIRQRCVERLRNLLHDQLGPDREGTLST